MELAEKKWYPSKKEQREGWGADYYKVGKTVGLGGVKLWDGEKVLDLNPVTNRSVRVTVFEDSSSMEMVSEGVPYMGKMVTIMVRVSVFSSKREAKVEAFSKTGEAVQFVTGLNYFKGLITEVGDNYALSWGVHPEDVAAEKVEVGAALMVNKNQIEKQMDDGSQFLFISKPTQAMSAWITSFNARESAISSFDTFFGRSFFGKPVGTQCSGEKFTGIDNSSGCYW